MSERKWYKLDALTMRRLAHDRRTGRKTLSVRFGVPVGRYLVTLLCLLPYTLGLCWGISGAWAAALLPILGAPLALLVIRDVHYYPPGPLLKTAERRAARLHAAVAALIAVGLVL